MTRRYKRYKIEKDNIQIKSKKIKNEIKIITLLNRRTRNQCTY